MLFRGMWVVYVGILLMGASWAYRAYRLGGITTPDEPGNEYWRSHYPELEQSGLLAANLSPDDGHFDVLILGGSVIEEASGYLEKRLRDEFGNRVRVYQLARAAHTSRDSWLKFSIIKDMHFDLIIDYDGVNDVRMNCCPDNEYRDDYTHCRWYRSLLRKQTAPSVSLTDLAKDEVQFAIPLGEPEPELLKFGSAIKTEKAFHDNLEQIVVAAKEKSEPVVLMTFAYYLPKEYSREKFQANQLDYGPGHYHLPAELWGLPENVAKTLDRQNLAIEKLAALYDNVIAVDQHKLLPADGVHFSDPCHLTKAGNERFVENAMPAILARLKPTSKTTK